MVVVVTRRSKMAVTLMRVRLPEPFDKSTELARLTIAHGVGVTPVAVYELKRVVSDFFAEERTPLQEACISK